MSRFTKTLSLLAAAGMSILISVSASASEESAAIAERLKPVGEVCMSGDECAAAPVAAAPAAPRSGEEVYKTKCFTCHGAGVAGAPKFGDAGEWAPRIGKGLDTLYTHALNGFNAMPAKGMCMDCSDDEVKQAVDYMTSQSK